MGHGAEKHGILTSSAERCFETLAHLSLRAGQPTVDPEWLIVDSVTAVEAYTDRAIGALLKRSKIHENALGRALLENFGEDITRSWPARYKWLAMAFGVDIRGQKFQQEFDTAVECRNAIIHGSGQLTRRQFSSFGKFIGLRRQLLSTIKVPVHGINLVISHDSARSSLTVSRNFVIGFDQAVSREAGIDF